MSDDEDSETNLLEVCQVSKQCMHSERETDSLFMAVHDDDLHRLKSLLNKNNINKRNRQGCPLITYAIQQKKKKIFNYLLTSEGVDIDALDANGQSPLFNAFFDEYFAKELINKGANIHLKDDKGFTLLHLGAWKAAKDTLGKVIIDMGVDINERNIYGETPIYVACNEGNHRWIYLLLYYGADVTIASDLGILPLTTLSDYDTIVIQEILYNFTFDKEKTVLPLPTVIQTMKRKTDLFDKILSVTSDITYDFQDLNFFAKHFLQLKAVHFRSFLRKFGHIVKDLTKNFPLLNSLLEVGAVTKNPEQKEILSALLESPYVYDLVQNCNQSCSVIANLMQMFDTAEEETEVCKIACVLLSYGLHVTSFDLDMVYSYRGCCELFQILLHMDVILVETHGKSMMASLYYDFNQELLLDKIFLSPEVFDYFNMDKLKKRCVEGVVNKSIAAKVYNLPSVALLVELSRNAAREFLVKKYKVTKCAEFYKVLNGLPIDKVTKSILALEKRLY